MGFIKAIETAAKGQLADTYREVIRYQNIDKTILVKRVTTANGVIQNESRLFVEPGQCAIYTDNGAVKDIITEPGMYFMDTSAPSLFQLNIFEGLGNSIMEAIKRVAYEGQVITTQAVYFISLAELPNMVFGTQQNILYKDPEWGPMELGLNGSYILKVINPVNLLTNINSNADITRVEDVRLSVNNRIVACVMEAVNKLNVTFDEIPGNINNVTDSIIEAINEKLDELGVGVTSISVSNITVPEEIKAAMRERTSIKMKATSVDNQQADIYTKLNTAEAIKDLANNSNNAGTSIMGMNLGNTVAGMINNNVNNNDNK